jgi:hypothetical protein
LDISKILDNAGSQKKVIRPDLQRIIMIDFHLFGQNAAGSGVDALIYHWISGMPSRKFSTGCHNSRKDGSGILGS